MGFGLFLKPADAGDVFVTLGSRDAYHLVSRADALGDAAKIEARCGRKGLRAKARLQAQYTVPANHAPRHVVCSGCRPFAAEADV